MHRLTTDPLLLVLAAVATLGGCAGPDPGPGDMVAAGTIVPPEILNCRGNRDGTIESHELPLLAGVVARQRVHLDVALQSAGSEGSRGLEWEMPDGGEIIDVATEQVDGMWFAEHFPDASYAVAANPAEPFDDHILSIYRVEEDRVMLLGVASRHSDRPQGGMLLPYNVAPTVLRFPVVLGDSWEEVATITNGTVGGVAYNSEDIYRIAVDMRGTVTTEDAYIRDALRFSIGLTVRTAALEAERLELAWYRECLGEVARAVAHEGDSGPELERAAQLRTLAF